MASNGRAVGIWNPSFKKGSARTVTLSFTNEDDGSVYSLSAFDTAEYYIYDDRDGTWLTTITGSLNAGAGTISLPFLVADTSALTADTAWGELWLSNSGDATISRAFLQGDVELGD